MRASTWRNASKLRMSLWPRGRSRSAASRRNRRSPVSQSWPGLHPARRDVHRKSECGVASGQNVAIDRQTFLQLVRRIDQRCGEDRKFAPCRDREGVGAVGGDPHRRMGRLHRPRHDAQIMRAKMLALVGEGVVGPGLDDEVERLLEALAALLLRYGVT